MNILFLTLLDFNSLEEHNIYTDLLREFTKNHHKVYAISPVECRKRQKTHLIKEKNAFILKQKIGNTQKTNLIEKGISTITIEPIFIMGIKKYFSKVKFDLVIYSTPPITFCKAIDYVKKRDGAKSYLLLKDIFPQNAVDIGILNKTGIKGVLYQYFRSMEKKLYVISDFIGCMSQANVDYVINHNPSVNPQKVEICPNSVEVIDMSVPTKEKRYIREKYGIPIDKTVYIYGGNLGKPQGIEFLIHCLKTQKLNSDNFFLIVGDGTEYQKLQNYIDIDRPQNVKVMQRLPKEDYDRMVGSCDIGMIFLDHRFTIPNFPSRLIAYMQAKIPVLAVTDSNTDIGKIIINGKFGWWCESDSVKKFDTLITSISKQDLTEAGEFGYQYLCNHYNVQGSYKIIISKISKFD